MPAPDTKLRTWLREAGVYIVMYGIPFVLLFPWTRFRPDARFVARVKTQAVEFTVNNYKGVGFAGGRADLAFEQFDRVELPKASSCQTAKGQLRFLNVKFQSLPLPDHTHLRIESTNQHPATGVRMVVQYGSAPSTPAAVFLDDQSSAVLGSCAVKGSGDGRGMARVFAQANVPLIVIVDPVPADPKKPAELVFDESESLLLAEHDLRFRLPNRSAILGFDGTVLVTNADRTERLLQGRDFRVDELRPGSKVADLRMQDDGIAVAIDGTAGVLRVDGRDIRPSPAEWLRAEKILSTWLAMVILIGSAGLTIASRIKLIKLDDKDK